MEHLENDMEQLRSRSANGEIDAMFQLGLMYWEGKDVENDMNKAVALINAAKLKGHPVADFYSDIIQAFKEELDNV